MEKHQIPWLRATLTACGVILLVGGLALTAILLGDLLHDIWVADKVDVKIEAKANLVGALIGSLMSGAIGAAAAIGVFYFERQHERRSMEADLREFSESAFGDFARLTIPSAMTTIEKIPKGFKEAKPFILAIWLKQDLKLPLDIENSMRDELARKLPSQASMLRSCESAAKALLDYIDEIVGYTESNDGPNLFPHGLDNLKEYYRARTIPLLTALHALVSKFDWLETRAELTARILLHRDTLIRETDEYYLRRFRMSAPPTVPSQ